MITAPPINMRFERKVDQLLQEQIIFRLRTQEPRMDWVWGSSQYWNSQLNEAQYVTLQPPSI